MGKNTVDVTDATFDSDVLKSDKTVLVDFWAEWCGPCKMVAPVLDEIAGENKDKLTVAKLDIDRNPNDGAGLPGHVDPDDDRLPGRQAGQADRRRQAEGRAALATWPTTWADRRRHRGRPRIRSAPLCYPPERQRRRTGNVVITRETRPRTARCRGTAGAGHNEVQSCAR